MDGSSNSGYKLKKIFFNFDFDDKIIILNQKNVVKNRLNSNRSISK